jgi:hypothetical protein
MLYKDQIAVHGIALYCVIFHCVIIVYKFHRLILHYHATNISSLRIFIFILDIITHQMSHVRTCRCKYVIVDLRTKVRQLSSDEICAH